MFHISAKTEVLFKPDITILHHLNLKKILTLKDKKKTVVKGLITKTNYLQSMMLRFTQRLGKIHQKVTKLYEVKPDLHVLTHET